MSDLVSCSRCGKIHARGYKCNIGRNWSEKTNADKLRNRRQWKKKAEQIKKEANYLCEVCYDQDIFTYDGLEVHHIRKLREYPDGLLEDDNLVCLCRYHHQKADNGEISVDYLKDLAERRQNA